MSASQIDPKPPVDAQERTAPAIAKGETSPATAKAAVAGRLLWMLFGPMMLFLSVVALATKANGFLTGADVFYVAALGAMFAGRWLEFRSGAAQTADGQPASARDVRRYYLLLGLSGLVVWLIASAIRTVGSIH
jgi:hypothetical protein